MEKTCTTQKRKSNPFFERSYFLGTLCLSKFRFLDTHQSFGGVSYFFIHSTNLKITIKSYSYETKGFY